MPLKVPLNTMTALMRSLEHSAEMSVCLGEVRVRAVAMASVVVPFKRTKVLEHERVRLVR